jgi:hypothetical protein
VAVKSISTQRTSHLSAPLFGSKSNLKIEIKFSLNLIILVERFGLLYGWFAYVQLEKLQNISLFCVVDKIRYLQCLSKIFSKSSALTLLRNLLKSGGFVQCFCFERLLHETIVINSDYCISDRKCGNNFLTSLEILAAFFARSYELQRISGTKCYWKSAVMQRQKTSV